MKASINAEKVIMKTSQSLADLYKAIEEMDGPAEAKKFVSSVVAVVIGSIQDEKLPVTEGEIERRLAQEAKDFRSMVDHHKKKSIA